MRKFILVAIVLAAGPVQAQQRVDPVREFVSTSLSMETEGGVIEVVTALEKGERYIFAQEGLKNEQMILTTPDGIRRDVTVDDFGPKDSGDHRVTIAGECREFAPCPVLMMIVPRSAIPQ